MVKNTDKIRSRKNSLRASTHIQNYITTLPNKRNEVEHHRFTRSLYALTSAGWYFCWRSFAWVWICGSVCSRTVSEMDCVAWSSMLKGSLQVVWGWCPALLVAGCKWCAELSSPAAAGPFRSEAEHLLHCFSVRPLSIVQLQEVGELLSREVGSFWFPEEVQALLSCLSWDGPPGTSSCTLQSHCLMMFWIL